MHSNGNQTSECGVGQMAEKSCPPTYPPSRPIYLPLPSSSGALRDAPERFGELDELVRPFSLLFLAFSFAVLRHVEVLDRAPKVSVPSCDDQVWLFCVGVLQRMLPC